MQDVKIKVSDKVWKFCEKCGVHRDPKSFVAKNKKVRKSCEPCRATTK